MKLIKSNCVLGRERNVRETGGVGVAREEEAIILVFSYWVSNTRGGPQGLQPISLLGALELLPVFNGSVLIVLALFTYVAHSIYLVSFL